MILQMCQDSMHPLLNSDVVFVCSDIGIVFHLPQ